MTNGEFALDNRRRELKTEVNGVMIDLIKRI
jgi:hypothetical protein